MKKSLFTYKKSGVNINAADNLAHALFKRITLSQTDSHDHAQ